MSTRATYQFNDPKGYHKSRTVYIHYDGYPEGAAYYFYHWLTLDNKRGCGATRMIRATEHAEMTSKHDDHGDTEWRYTVDGVGAEAAITIEEYVWATDTWRLFEVCTVLEFIQKHDGMAKDLPPILKLDDHKNAEYQKTFANAAD